MAMPSRRQVTFHRFQLITRCIFSPPPISDTITISSVARSTSTGVLSGCGAQLEKGGREKIAKPMPTHMIGSDNGSRLRNSGTQATNRIIAPTPNIIGR